MGQGEGGAMVNIARLHYVISQCIPCGGGRSGL